jgi:hypothetical protein
VRELEGAKAAAKRAKREKHKRTWEEIETEVVAAAPKGPRYANRYGDMSDGEDDADQGVQQSSSKSGTSSAPTATGDARCVPLLHHVCACIYMYASPCNVHMHA